MTNELEVVEDVMRRALYCRIAMCDGGTPRIVPMNFGYDGSYLYLHSGKRSGKLDVLRRNPAVCFQADVDVEVVGAEQPCRWSMRYRSVVGKGKVQILDDREDKIFGLDVLMRHYGWDKAGFVDAALERVAVLRVEIEEITAKVSGYDS
ncbi:MAG: pyridoxamine 5'-phosphate oxidase family protein [Planctomycetes bacterium]|nr:pyridoxamine 5'-phosphate oxidase family protein [Planctomycetota bacterium]